MKGLRWEAALVGLVALAATLAATERTPLTWDEGDAFVRAERVAAWTRAVVVGPQKLNEALNAKEAKSRNGADGGDSNAQTLGGASPDKNVAPGETSANSTRLAPLNAESREAGETRKAETASEAERTGGKECARRRFGDVELAALEYFARFEGRRALFSTTALEAGWPHAIYREGHPAGYSIAIASGRAFSLRFLPFLSEKAAFRFGPIALFAAALAAVFYRVARNWGRSAAFLAIIGVMSIPRAFGHAQLAGGDSLLISSWLLAWAFFDAALSSKRGAVALGTAVGVSFCAKFSGFLVVAPLTAGALAALWARRRSGARGGELREENASGTRRDGALAAFGRLASAFGVAAAIFFAANPPLWARPISGFETFVSLNLRRDGFDIPIYFLGNFYSPSRPAPWWNGFFWLATTVPTGLLAFAALGGVATAFRRNWKNNAVGETGEIAVNGENITPTSEENAAVVGAARLSATESEENSENERGDADVGGRSGRGLAGLALAFAATLPLVRVIPGIPTHDGARLLIASFPFVAILAALGATVFVERLERTAATIFLKRTRRQAAATLDAVVEKIVRLEGGGGPDAANECREQIWVKWEERRKLEEPEKRKRDAKIARRAAQVVVAATFAVGCVDWVRSAPQYLSFYNATLGGVVGATRRGMEATYYWDAFDADAVAWLNAEIAAARAADRPSGVLFGSFSAQTLDYYRRWGTLATPETETLSTPNVLADRKRFGFYVVQRRPSGWTALELALFKTARPIYRKTVRNPLDFRKKTGGRREVVLLEIYDFRDVERILKAMERAQEEKKASGEKERRDGEPASR